MHQSSHHRSIICEAERGVGVVSMGTTPHNSSAQLTTAQLSSRQVLEHGDGVLQPRDEAIDLSLAVVEVQTRTHATSYA